MVVVVSVMIEIINVIVPQETQCVVDIYILSNKRLFVLSENKKQQILFIFLYGRTNLEYGGTKLHHVNN